MSAGIGYTMQNPTPYMIEQVTAPSGYTGPAFSCASGSTSDCTQLWGVSFRLTGVGSSGTCSPSGTIRFSFSVLCNGISGCVSPGNTNSYDLTSTLSATNLCSQLVETSALTTSVALYNSDANAGTATSPVTTFNLGDTVYFVASLTATGGPPAASADLLSFSVQSSVFISGITVANPKGLNGVSSRVYSPNGATIRPGLTFVVDTNAVQFNDLNINQAATITVNYNVNYQIPLDAGKLLPQAEQDASKDIALMDNSDAVSVTSAFVLTPASEAPAEASTTSTLVIAIAAVGGFLVLTLLVVLVLSHRHVKNMHKPQPVQQVMQVFVPMASSSNLVSTSTAPLASAPVDPATQA